MADPVATEIAGGLSTTATTTVAFSARAAGELLVLSAATDDYRTASGAGRPESTGWTLVDSEQSNLGLYVWWKIATGGETSVQYTIASANRSAYAVQSITNIDAAATLGVSASNQSPVVGTRAVWTSPEVTPTAGSRWIVVASIGSTGNVTAGPYTWTAPYVEMSERYHTTGYRPGLTVAVLVLDGGTATSGTATFATGTSDQGMGIIAAFKNAAGAGSTTGAGAATSPAGTAAGAGATRDTGSGAGTAPAGTATGAGQATASGTGAAASPDGTATGQGTPTTSGTGTATAPAGDAEGTATSTSTGAGQATSPAGTADGDGEATVTGQGGATSPPGVASGDSAAPGPTTGQGAAQAPDAVAAGTGTSTATGQGTAAAPEGSATGQGGASTAGEGAATGAPGVAAGQGTATVTGHGQATAFPGVAAGIGEATTGPPPDVEDIAGVLLTPARSTLLTPARWSLITRP